MKTLLILFDTLLICILTLGIACAAYMHRRNGNLGFLYLLAAFALYLCNDVMIFCTEMIPAFAQVYDRMLISTASVQTVYYVCLMSCLASALYHFLKVGKPKYYFVMVSLYAALLVYMPMIPNPQLMVFFYYLPTQVLFVLLAAIGIYFIRKYPEQFHHQPYFTLHMALIFIIGGALLVFLEDSVVIFLYDLYTKEVLKISSRSITENILFLGMSLFFIVYTVESLDSMETIPLPIPETASAPVEEFHSAMAFGNAYGLTERECEILALLLEGKSQQEICDQVFIALGTVKTHIHNLYSKMDVSRRSQLMAKYQEFCDALASEV